MSDRGDYRSFYVSMLDDPDFRDMPGEDFKIFFALKLTLGAAGIGVLRPLVLCDQLKISPRKLELRLASLEKPKPESDLGWIVWDRRNNIIWIVNALKYEPTLFAKNLNQRKFINGFLKPLSPHSKAVQGFWKAYPEWQIEAPSTTPDPSPDPYHIEGDTQPPPNGVGMGSEGGLKHKRRETRDERLETGDKKQAKTDLDISRATPLERFVDRYYRDSSPERRAEVARQLEQSLEPEGVRVRNGVSVRAKNREHLNRCISAVLRGTQPSNPEAAIVFVFRKLEDPEKDERGNVGTEITAAKNKAAVAEANAYHRAARAAAKPWGAEHPTELADIEALAHREIPGESDLAETTRRAFVLQRICKLIEFPSFERWIERQTESQAVPA